MIFSSVVVVVVVGNFDVVIELRMVVSGIFSIIACSLLASVLLSVFRTVVIGTYLTVVVSGLYDDSNEYDGGIDDGNIDDESFGVVTFW